jgi:UDPglucose 6-dehydrogenase
MKLGIVGHGFVGSAVDHGFTKNCDKYIIDPKLNNNSIKDLIEFGAEISFICVPTPQAENGECRTDIVFDVCSQLNTQRGHLVILKSTVPAYKLNQLQAIFKNIRLVYNPEFLTEKNYIQDFQNPPMHVFGGQEIDTKQVETLYSEHSICRQCPVFHTDLATASFVKYSINSFLATKVTFFNELYDVFKASGGKEFDKLTQIMSTDPRIGVSHMKVPGNNGERGYGGSCFPKDTAALAYFAREILNTPFTQLETSIAINEKLRKTDH